MFSFFFFVFLSFCACVPSVISYHTHVYKIQNKHGRNAHTQKILKMVHCRLGGWNAAAAAAAAAAGTMNPMQIASSMKMIASMNMNLGVKMGLNLARMGGGVGLTAAGGGGALQPGAGDGMVST